jgi:hypothetical protein
MCLASPIQVHWHTRCNETKIYSETNKKKALKIALFMGHRTLSVRFIFAKSPESAPAFLYTLAVTRTGGANFYWPIAITPLLCGDGNKALKSHFADEKSGINYFLCITLGG